MSGVIPPPTDPDDRPRPPRTHHYPRRRRRAPGRLLGKYQFGYHRPKHLRRDSHPGVLARVHLRDLSCGDRIFVEWTERLERGSLINSPRWRAALRGIIEREDLRTGGRGHAGGSSPCSR